MSNRFLSNVSMTVLQLGGASELPTVVSAWSIRDRHPSLDQSS